MADGIRVVVLKDDDIYVAQCLEVDVAAQGATPEQAMQRLKVALCAEEEEARQSGKSLDDIGPAPDAFRAVYDGDVVDRTCIAA